MLPPIVVKQGTASRQVVQPGMVTVPMFNPSLFGGVRSGTVINQSGQQQVFIANQSLVSAKPTVISNVQILNAMSGTPAVAAQKPATVSQRVVIGAPQVAGAKVAIGAPQVSGAKVAIGAPQVSGAKVAIGAPQVSGAKVAIGARQVSGAKVAIGAAQASGVRVAAPGIKLPTVQNQQQKGHLLLKTASGHYQLVRVAPAPTASTLAPPQPQTIRLATLPTQKPATKPMAVLKNIPVQAKINGSKVNIGKAMTVNGKVNPSRAVVPKGAIPTVLTPGKSLLKGNSALPTALTPAKFFLKENQSLPSPATSQKSILKENSVLFTAKTEQAAHKENEAKPQYYSMPFLDVDEKTGEDEINNVAAMGGVNVVEESQKSIASVGTQIRSCQDEYLVPMSVMQARLKASVAKHDLEEPSAEVACLINHAVQERLKTLIEKLAVTAKSRVDNTIKTDKRYEVTQDVRGQLRFLEELDYAERKKRREEERERLLRAAKARARNGDPDHAELKAKAKKLKRAEEEEHQQREANLTALQAIGPRKKPRLDLAALTGRSHPPPPKRINQRDLLNLLEQERGSSCSLMLFKSYLK